MNGISERYLLHRRSIQPELKSQIKVTSPPCERSVVRYLACTNPIPHSHCSIMRSPHQDYSYYYKSAFAVLLCLNNRSDPNYHASFDSTFRGPYTGDCEDRTMTTKLRSGKKSSTTDYIYQCFAERVQIIRKASRKLSSSGVGDRPWIYTAFPISARPTIDKGTHRA